MEHAAFSGGDKQNSLPFAPCSTCPPNAVYVRITIERNVVVDDVSNALDIEASRCHIGGDHNIDLTRLQLLDCFDSSLLIDIAIQRRRVKTTLAQLIGEGRCALASSNKNNHTLGLFIPQKPSQRIEFIGALYQPIQLLDIGIGGRG